MKLKSMMLAGAAALALGMSSGATAGEKVKFSITTPALDGIYFQVVVLDSNNEILAQTWDIKTEVEKNADGMAVRYVEFPLENVTGADRWCVSFEGFAFKVRSPHDGKLYEASCTTPGQFKPTAENTFFPYIIRGVVAS